MSQAENTVISSTTGITSVTTMAGLSPSAHQHQHGDDAGGHEQLEDQLVDLVVGGLAVVAGDLDLDLVRDQPPLERLDHGQDVVGHRDAVGALLLGDRDRDRLVAVGLPLGAIRLGIARPV